MKKKTFFCLFTITILLSITFSFLFYSFYIVKDVFNYEMDAIISSGEAGFNLDKDRIHFGIVPVLGVSSRKISLTNNWNEEITASLKINGDLSSAILLQVLGNEDIFYEKGFFKLAAGETKEIEIKFIPQLLGKKDGFYEGRLNVLIKRAKMI